MSHAAFRERSLSFSTLVGNLNGLKQGDLAGMIMYTTQLMVSLLLVKSNNHHRMADSQSPQTSVPTQKEVNCGTVMTDISSCEHLTVDWILRVWGDLAFVAPVRVKVFTG